MLESTGGREKPSCLVCHRADGLPGQVPRGDPHSRSPVCGGGTSAGLDSEVETAAPRAHGRPLLRDAMPCSGDGRSCWAGSTPHQSPSLSFRSSGVSPRSDPSGLGFSIVSVCTAELTTRVRCFPGQFNKTVDYASRSRLPGALAGQV